MSGAGCGGDVVVDGASKVGAGFHQKFESADFPIYLSGKEVGRISLDVVSSELVDRNEDDQFGRMNADPRRLLLGTRSR